MPVLPSSALPAGYAGLYTLLCDKFPVESLRYDEVAFTIENYRQVVFSPYMVYKYDKDARGSLLLRVRAVVSDDSALLWALLVDHRFGGYALVKDSLTKYGGWVDECVEVASRFCYDDVADYIAGGIWDAGLIERALADGVDAALLLNMER